MVKIVALTLGAYCLMAIIWCGDLLSPVADLLLWPDRLGIAWRSWLLIIAVASTAVFLMPYSLRVTAPLYVLTVMTLSVVSIAIYVDHLRASRLAEFAPDALIDHSFFRSIRIAPREDQFDLHAAALKRCTPYGWSYRMMDLYEIPPDAAVNVLPIEWTERCGIHRS